MVANSRTKGKICANFCNVRDSKIRVRTVKNVCYLYLRQFAVTQKCYSPSNRNLFVDGLLKKCHDARMHKLAIKQRRGCAFNS